jgi:hypothetical protein
MWPGDESLDWWPPHVQVILAAIGQAMGGKRLHPETLRSVPSRFGGILSGHQVTIEHISAKELGRRRKGRYQITVEGPVFGGQWGFRSGELERLSRAAANAKGGGGLIRLENAPGRRSLEKAMVIAVFAIAGMMWASDHFRFYRETVWSVLSPIGALLVTWAFVLLVRRKFDGRKQETDSGRSSELKRVIRLIRSDGIFDRDLGSE